MFLFTFVFLVIGMLSIYTQVFAVQTARLFASQTTVAQAMINWHSGALSLAQGVINPQTANGGGQLTQAGCSLTFSLTAIPYCKISANPGFSGGPNVYVNVGGSYADASNHPYPHLPGNYNTNVYQWNSIAFISPTDAYYVITYVPPAHIVATNPAPGFLNLPAWNQAPATLIGITASDLYRQIKNTGLTTLNYGYVSNPTGANATLITNTNTANIGVFPATYAVPSAVPDGSLGIISVAGQCSGC